MTDQAPPTENKEAAKIDSAVGALANVGVSSVEAMIIADVPWLAWPVIKQLWEIPFGWVSTYFVKAAKNGITFAVVDIQVAHEESNLSKELAAVVAAEKTGDPVAIKKAIQDYADAQSALLHSDGSYHA